MLSVRFGQIFIYPLLVWTLNFPKYKSGDWMTGVYSFGGEMLRNVESFWCPIRFYDGKKCENCKIDFPDLKDWVAADASMTDVATLLTEKYPLRSKTPRSWFGHPERKKN